MEIIIYTIGGLLVGYLLGKLMKKKLRNPSTPQEPGQTSSVGKVPNQEQIDAKQENLQKILNSFGPDDEITNDAVEKMLRVSDATAERYLDELEKQGKLTQVGRTGRSVVYKKK